MQRIEAVWHILEAKASWSLRSSLSNRISCGSQPALEASRPTAPGTSTSPSSAPSGLNSQIPSAYIAQSAVPGPGLTGSLCLSVPVPTVPPSSDPGLPVEATALPQLTSAQGLSVPVPTVLPSSGPGLPVEATALLGTSADTGVPFLDLSSVPLTQELPLEAAAPESL